MDANLHLIQWICFDIKLEWSSRIFSSEEQYSLNIFRMRYFADQTLAQPEPDLAILTMIIYVQQHFIIHFFVDFSQK